MTSPYWHGRAVCVTGGTGFLGWHLARQLVEQGARVRVLALKADSAHPINKEKNLDRFWGDVRDEAVVRAALRGCSVVFHTAGVVGVWGKVLERMWSVHVDGTRQVLANLDPGARLVHTSSITTLGGSTRPRPVDEDMTWNGAASRVPYVQAKRAAEKIVLESGSDMIITNPGYLVGPDDHENSIMGRLCERYWRGRAPLAPPGGLNLADVRDVARGHLLAAERGQAGKRYLLGGENHSFAAFFRLLAAAAGYRPRGLPRLPLLAFTALARLAELRASFNGKEPYPSLAHAAMNQFFWYGSSTRAQNELGYRCRPLLKTLRDTFAWFGNRQPFGLRGLNRWWLRPTAA